MSANPYQPPESTREASCSFCQRSYRETGPLVEAPGEIFICQTCAALCDQMIADELRRRQKKPGLINWLASILPWKPTN